MSQKTELDKRLAHIDLEDRTRIWESASNLLLSNRNGSSTAMALGYVQSGKTTSIAALCAAAADEGFKLIIALLGSTVILTDQNRNRVEEYHGIETSSYSWKSFSRFDEKTSPREISEFLGRGRTVLVPFIKNASVIEKLGRVLSNLKLDGVKVLIVDDEADQASLNTRVANNEMSSTYRAIQNLRTSVGEHFFVQYTATPYAPLLLDPNDPLQPKTVEFLSPGKGYTGGRQFFIDHRAEVVRVIPDADEQKTRTPISALPKSLELAFCNFIVGATHLFNYSQTNAPVSMLIHSTGSNALQGKYDFLLRQYLASMRAEASLKDSYFGALIESERRRLYSLGITKMTDEEFWTGISYTLEETTLWLLNSASDVKKISWKDAPFHVLIGGNKLDRGFTVEGLTVTYMNRPASQQIDTVEQRARAFGYRKSLIPFCQFFATAKTIQMLTDIVHTEDDLRVSLRDYLERGRSVSEWSQEVGLLLPAGTLPSRRSVTPGLNYFNPDGAWHSIRKPTFDAAKNLENQTLLTSLGLAFSKVTDFGRLSHPTSDITLDNLIELLQKWNFDESSPMWRHEGIIDFLKRQPKSDRKCRAVLMASPDQPNSPRIRGWSDELGFSNLFQGADLDFKSNNSSYPGDMNIWKDDWSESDILLEIHFVAKREQPDRGVYTLAIKLQGQSLVKRIGEAKNGN